LSGVKTAIAGGPALVEAGTIPGWKPPQPRHPRTALGWNDAHLFLVVVDGRQPALSVGMTMPELAELMQRLGCRDALNLDGGGSSTFWLDGKLVNSPSDGWERAVANGLVVVQTRGSGKR
jgi:exopolysaccharide biosynthesis protein